MNFQIHFFFDFRGFREDRTLKIEPKRCSVVQNQGYHHFFEKRALCKHISKSDPSGTPETMEKSKKNIYTTIYQSSMIFDCFLMIYTQNVAGAQEWENGKNGLSGLAREA